MVCLAIGSGVGDDVAPSVGDGDGARVGGGVGGGVGKGIDKGVVKGVGEGVATGTGIHPVCPGSSLVHSLAPHALHITAPANAAKWPLAHSTHPANNGSCIFP